MAGKKVGVDWARLSQIWCELDSLQHPLHCALTPSCEAVVASAVKSGSFPVRGHRDLASYAGDVDFVILNRGNAYERIDKLMTPDAKISVYGDTVTVKLPPAGGATVVNWMQRGSFTPEPSVFTAWPRWIKYNDVEADRGAVETWIRENALPADWIITAGPTSEVDQRAAAELAARDYLQGLPPYAPIKTKKEFYREINHPDHELYETCGKKKLSERALEKVWSSAPLAWRRGGRRPENRG